MKDIKDLSLADLKAIMDYCDRELRKWFIGSLKRSVLKEIKTLARKEFISRMYDARCCT